MNLYLEDGEDLISQLNGIFAFALYDKKKNQILLARDAMGVKPLYWSEMNDGFIFASEIKAIREMHSGPLSIDIDALKRYMTFLWCPGEGTPVKEVHKLPPGEAMWIKDGLLTRQWQWYRLPVFNNPEPITDFTDAVSGTVDNLRQAVHRQMVADVPVGAFLSGGLDSSSVVAFASELNPNIHCFTIEIAGGHDDGLAEDLPYARKVAKYLDVPLDVVTVDASRMAIDLEKLVSQLDEPLADPAPLNVLYISQLARKYGMKVLLSGAGGDDLFTGYRRHRAIMAEKYWKWMPLQFRRTLQTGTFKLDQRIALFRRLAKLFSGAGLDGTEGLINYFYWIQQNELEILFRNEYRRRNNSIEVAQPMLDFLRPIEKNAHPLDQMLALEQRFFLTDHNLTYTDKMSMAAGVEVRVPFLDLDLVSFASRISANIKQKGRHGKIILKKAMEPFLPADIIYRPKTGFGAPLRHWMRYELNDMLEDLLSVQSVKKRGIFDEKAVQELISSNQQGKIDASYTLLSLLSIEIWFRSFLD